MPDLPDIVALAVPFFLVSLVAEYAWGRLTGRVRYETRDTAASLAMGVGNLVIGLLAGALGLGLLMLFQPYAVFDFGWTLPAFVVAFLLDDLRYYVYHRISHRSRFWWAFGHVTHHSSQHYNLSTALRQEWSGPFNGALLLRVPLVLIGIHPLMLVFLGGVNLVYQYWIHTEAIGRFPRAFEFVMNTPSHHRVHHGSNPRYLDANYGGTFIFWDRLFGTFVPELDEEPVRYGLVKNLGTFNPLRIGFHGLIDLVGDMAQPGLTLGERAWYLVGPPGWRHDGPGQTSAVAKRSFVENHPGSGGTPGLSDL